MTVIATRKLADIAERIGLGQDPRQTLLDAVGEENIASYHPAYHVVLVATYARSNKSKGGIILGGDITRAEDRYQSKIGLVLKLGPSCFEGDKFCGFSVKPGDWVHYRVSDAIEFFFVDQMTGLDGASVRLIDDSLVLAKIEDPERVF
jgi:co-chaperonin GroES (HSP10)